MVARAVAGAPPAAARSTDGPPVVRQRAAGASAKSSKVSTVLVSERSVYVIRHHRHRYATELSVMIRTMVMVLATVTVVRPVRARQSP